MAQDLDTFPVLERAIKLSSMTAAARELGKRKDSVSLRVKNLEKFLGVKLLERTTRIFNLTEAGKQFLKLYAPLWRGLLYARRVVRGEEPAPLWESASLLASGKIEIVLRQLEDSRWAAVCRPFDQIVVGDSLPDVFQKLSTVLLRDLARGA